MNMKKYARVLSAMTLLCGMSVAAKAELRDDVSVTVPFDFVVGRKTLPAGTYVVTSLSLNQSSPLRLTSRENNVSVFVLPLRAKALMSTCPS